MNKLPPTIPQLARNLGLPAYVLRRWLDRKGLINPPRYPHQRRRIPPNLLPAIRRGLKADGYLPQPERTSAR